MEADGKGTPWEFGGERSAVPWESDCCARGVKGLSDVIRSSTEDVRDECIWLSPSLSSAVSIGSQWNLQ